MKDKLIFGKNVKTGLHEIIDPVLSPGTLFVGGVGSGVDIAARFTVAQRFASNSHQDLYIFSSPLFGKMEEFSCFFAYKKNVVKAFSLDQLIDVVDMIYVEIVERKKAFLRLKVNNIYEYESVIKQKYPDYKLARIFLYIQSFQSFPVSSQIDFKNYANVPGSTAFKIKELVEIGKNYGFNLIATSLEATVNNFPNILKSGIKNIMAFRVNDPRKVSGINMPQATNIRFEQRGFCFFESGSMQFPFFDDDMIHSLISVNYQSMTANFLTYSVDDYISNIELRFGPKII